LAKKQAETFHQIKRRRAEMPKDMMEMPLTKGQMKALGALLMNRPITTIQMDTNNIKMWGATDFAPYAWKCVFWNNGDTVLYHPWKREGMESYRSARAGNLLDWTKLIIWRLRQGW
jgi:hypothetical protein